MDLSGRVTCWFYVWDVDIRRKVLVDNCAKITNHCLMSSDSIATYILQMPGSFKSLSLNCDWTSKVSVCVGVARQQQQSAGVASEMSANLKALLMSGMKKASGAAAATQHTPPHLPHLGEPSTSTYLILEMLGSCG